MEDATEDKDDHIRSIVEEVLSDSESNVNIEKKSIYNRTTYVVPDYETHCQSCGSVPTVVVKRGQQEHKTHLCGVCCWGEAAAVDPANW